MGGYPTGTLEVSRGLVDGVTAINLIGRNLDITTSYEPICAGGIIHMPQIPDAGPVRIRAGGDAADSPTGAGARTIGIAGLDPTGERIINLLSTNGVSASAFTTDSFWRVNEVFVVESGNYPVDQTPPAGNVGTITIEDAAGNAFAVIAATSGLGRARSQIGAFHVPAGHNYYLEDIGFSTDDSANRVDLVGMARPNANLTAPPYTPFITFFEKRNFGDATEYRLTKPLGPFPAFTDVVFYAKATSPGQEITLSADGALVRERPFTDINGLSLADITP